MNRLLLVAIALSFVQQSARSEPPVRFRVISKIYVGAEAQPSAEHLILFDSGVAYDLPQSRGQAEGRFVTVYDPAQERVTLLDRLTQVQTTLSSHDLTKISVQARTSATDTTQQEKLGLLAKVTVDAKTGLREIKFGNIAYAITTQSPKGPLVASHYGTFFDLAARLNIHRRLGPPPFARMRLNDHITATRELPLETKLTITRDANAETYRSTLLLQESLLDGDRKQIEEVRGMLELYRDVPPADFPRDDDH